MAIRIWNRTDGLFPLPEPWRATIAKNGWLVVDGTEAEVRERLTGSSTGAIERVHFASVDDSLIDTPISAPEFEPIVCRVATAAALPAYTRTGDVLLADANGAMATVDGATMVVGNVFLLKDGAAGADNGPYEVEAVGGAAARWQARRIVEFNESADVVSGMLFQIQEGAVNPPGQLFRLATTGTIVLNTTALSFLPTSSALGAIIATVNDAVTNAVTDVATLRHLTTGTAANGIGTGILLQSEDAAGNVEDVASFDGVLTTAANGTEASAIVFSNRTGGAALAEVLRIPAGGGLTAPASQTWQVNGSSAGNLVLTIDVVNAGAGEGRLSLNADEQIDLNDGTATLTMDGGALTTTALASASITPSGALTLTAGATSTWSTSAGSLNLTSAAGATWQVSGNAAGNLILTIDAVNAGAGEGRLSLNADDQVDISDSTATITLDGGALTTTALASASVTPSGAITLTAGATSTWSTTAGALNLTSADSATWQVSGNAAGNLILTIDAVNAGAGEGRVAINADDQIDLNDGTATLTLNGGAFSTTALASASITPSGALTLTAGATSTWSTSAGALNLTSADSATWQVSGNAAGNLILTLDAVNAGAGEGRLALNADNQIDLNDGTATLTMDGGAVSLASASSVSLTPSAAMTLTCGATSVWSLSGNAAGALALTLDVINAGAGTGTLVLTADDTVQLGDAGNPAITQVGSGTVTFTGNVDATLGLDVTGGALTTAAQNVTLTLGAANIVLIDASTTAHTDTAGALDINLATGTANVVGATITGTMSADVNGVAGLAVSMTGPTPGGTTGNVTTGVRVTLTGDNNDTDHEYVAFDAANFAATGGASTSIGLSIGTGFDTAIIVESGSVLFEDYAATIQTFRATAGVGNDLTVRGASGSGAGNNGGRLVLYGGASGGGGGVDSYVHIGQNVASTPSWVATATDDDCYVVGRLEVDGAATFDAGVTTTSVTLSGRLLTDKGADIASATDITLGADGNFFDITGAVQIDTIVATGWQVGSIVVLQFDSNPVVRHGAGGVGASFQLAGAGNFATSAGDTLTVVYDGVFWREIARTVI